MIPSVFSPVYASSSIILHTFSTIELSTIVLIIATLLYSVIIIFVPLSDLIFCLFPEPLPFPSIIVNPPTTPVIASDIALILFT